MSQQAPPAVRRSSPKVRTGCETCKKRHIKCDETRPSCGNCTKSGRTCSGYFIKPRKNQSVRYTDRLRSGYSLLCGPDINSLHFQNDLEAQYFDQWRHLSQSLLGGYSSSKLWTVFMPQITRHSRILRHAAIATGAMNRALRTCKAKDLEGSVHYQHAVAQYCIALHLQAKPKTESVDIQELMLASILFICFEAFRSNQHVALQHITHGTLLLQTLLSINKSSSLTKMIAPDPWELISEIVKLFLYLGVQTQTVIKRRLDSTTPPAVMLLQDAHSSGRSMKEVDENLEYYLTPRLRRLQGGYLPLAFSSVQEATEYWSTVELAMKDHMPSFIECIPNMRIQRLETDCEVGDFFDSLADHPGLHCFIANTHNHLRRWYEAFQPLYQRAYKSQNLDSMMYKETVYLYLKYLELHLFVMFPKQGSHKLVASLTSRFRLMTELCEILAQSHCKEDGSLDYIFSMQSTVLWHLMFVAMTCREAEVRDHAIRIMDTYPHRDGIWNHQAFLAVAEQNRKLEIENSKEGVAQEQWRRLCRRAFRFEDSGSRVVLRSMRKSCTGGWKLVEEVTSLKQIQSQGWKNAKWERVSPISKSLILQWGRTTDISSMQGRSRFLTGCVSLNIP